MPFEQFKVLVYASARMNKELEEAASNAVGGGLRAGSTPKATTFRIIEEG